MTAGIAALSVCFALGALIAGLTCIALLLPGDAWAPLWRLNPQAYAAFLSMGRWAILLMAVVAAACGLAARGLWIRAIWGRRVALAVLVVNLVGDLTSAVVRHDPRTLIGLPIGGAFIAYLLSARVRGQFARAEDS